MPIRDSYEPGRPCWVDLSTSDPGAARSFYTELFGWEVQDDPRPEAGGYAQFMRDGHTVAGVGPIPQEGIPPTWTTYVATENVDVTADVVAANGGTILQPPMQVLDAGRMALFTDPTGAVLGLWEAQNHIGAQFVTEPGGWSWSQLMTRDREAALKFYEEVFDWHLESHPDWGEYLALHKGGGEIAGVSEMGSDFPAEMPAHWQVTFMVPDADDFAALAQGLGGKSVAPVEDMAMGGRVGAIADPQGAIFSVLSFARLFSQEGTDQTS